MPFQARNIYTLSVLILTAMASLYGADRFLARLEEREIKVQSRRLFSAGEDLLRQGRAREAAEKLQAARALDRSDRNYALGLAEAQLANRQPEAARSTLDTVLQRDSNNARGNLLMARVLVAGRDEAAAESFYHRAIYGDWPPFGRADRSAQAARLATRLELADLLARRGRQTELLSELLPLESAAGSDPNIAARLPGLFLRAGSSARASTAYEALIARDRNNIAAYRGLGQAQLAGGNFRAALNAFISGLRVRADDRELLRGAALASRVLALDPTSRRLTSHQKFKRSQEILALVSTRIQSCVGASLPRAPVDPLLQTARFLLDESVSRPTNELAEARLDLAEQLWNLRAQVCVQPATEDQTLEPILRKLALQ